MLTGKSGYVITTTCLLLYSMKVFKTRTLGQHQSIVPVSYPVVGLLRGVLYCIAPFVTCPSATLPMSPSASSICGENCFTVGLNAFTLQHRNWRSDRLRHRHYHSLIMQLKTVRLPRFYRVERRRKDEDEDCNCSLPPTASL